MEAEWNGHTLKVTGNWTARWLFLAPVYELWLDDQRLARSGGPRLHPDLVAVVVDEDGKEHHVEADVLSVIGFKPSCDLIVEGEVIHSGRVVVENFINPFLVIIILASTIVMIVVGPEVLRQYLP